MVEDDNTLLLKQAESEKAELARKIEELETNLKSRQDEASTQQDDAAAKALLLAEAEAERERALELAEQFALEK